MKYYIVQKIGYEYNDETYYPTQNDDGRPERVFKSVKKAQEYADELSLKELREVNLNEYGYSFDEIFKHTGIPLEKLLTKVSGGDSWKEDWYSFAISGSATDKDLKDLTKYLSIKFYEVIECGGE